MYSSGNSRGVECRQAKIERTTADATTINPRTATAEYDRRSGGEDGSAIGTPVQRYCRRRTTAEV